MKQEEIAVVVTEALDTVPFDPPVDWQYCAKIRDHIMRTKPTSVEVYYQGAELRVRVQHGSVVYKLTQPLE